MQNKIDLTTFNHLLGKLIREMREEKGFSQAKLAEIASLHENTIKTIELGEKNPKIYTLYKISIAFEVELEYLISNI